MPSQQWQSPSASKQRFIRRKPTCWQKGNTSTRHRNLSGLARLSYKPPTKKCPTTMCSTLEATAATSSSLVTTAQSPSSATLNMAHSTLTTSPRTCAPGFSSMPTRLSTSSTMTSSPALLRSGHATGYRPQSTAFPSCSARDGIKATPTTSPAHYMIRRTARRPILPAVVLQRQWHRSSTSTSSPQGPRLSSLRTPAHIR